MACRPSGVRRPTVVSLFTGAGGLDLGLEVAGFRTVSALDSDASCIATLRANQEKGIAILGGQDRFLSGTKILQKAIEDTSAKDLGPYGAAAGWRPDLLAGGPPCQPFSSAGKQLALNDPRGKLFEHFVRLAAELQPRLVLFENVRGLVTAPGPSGEPGEALALVRAEFERIGYATSFALLNAADYGVPQRRVRLFMLATTRAPLPLFPEPTHAEAGGASLLFGVRKRWVTLGEFLANHGVPREEDVERPSARLAALLEGVRAGSGLKSPGAREATRPGGHWGYKQGTFVADLTKPARTVTAAATQDWVRDRSGLRRLTWPECAGLQGFPKQWVFVGAKASRFRQIGNAVPAAFGVVVGQALLASLKARRDVAVASASWPESFRVAMAYTKKEQERNGESRRIARLASAGGSEDILTVKGLGSEERQQRRGQRAS